MLALKSFRTAAITLAGIELAHRIRKGQFSIGRGCSSLKQLWTRALAQHQAERETVRAESHGWAGLDPNGRSRPGEVGHEGPH